MITATNLIKNFDGHLALDAINTTIQEGAIYGLVGSNGSGKSTLMRLISGIYKADGGSITINGEDPFENPKIKEQVVLVADEPYFFPGATMDEMAKYYQNMFPSFDTVTYSFLCNNFPINPKRPINTFSKGMKRQVALILGLATRPRILLLDEAFDGLDPVMRNLLRKILTDAIAERNLTVVIASHNLRELEDLCDHMGLLHQGHIIFEREIDEEKLGVAKVQAGFATIPAIEALSGLDIVKYKISGSVLNLIVRGSNREIQEYLSTYNPYFVETLPLTLEEVFIYEMEAVGYDYSNLSV